jgi:hypothetical protein
MGNWKRVDRIARLWQKRGMDDTLIKTHVRWGGEPPHCYWFRAIGRSFSLSPVILIPIVVSHA